MGGVNLRFQSASAENSLSAADRAEGKSEYSHFHFKVQPNETHLSSFFNCWALAEVLISPERTPAELDVLFSFFNFAHAPTCEVI